MVDLRDRYWQKLDEIDRKLDSLALTLASEYATKEETTSAKRWAISAVVSSFVAVGTVLAVFGG